MAEFVDEHIVFLIYGIPLDIMLGSYSLLYRIKMDEVPLNIVEDFIADLAWPLCKIYGRAGVGFNLVGYKDKHPSLVTPPERTFIYLSARFIILALSAIVSIGYGVTLLRLDSPMSIEGLNYLIGLIISLYFLYRAWYFGHKLKDMQGTADQAD